MTRMPNQSKLEDDALLFDHAGNRDAIRKDGHNLAIIAIVFSGTVP